MDPLWERHVKKAFGDAVTKSKEETWYGCYQVRHFKKFELNLIFLAFVRRERRTSKNDLGKD
jgi:hypothetical protein